MSRRPRRRFSDVQQTKAVLAHVQDGVPVSQVCENLGLHPNQHYEWQKQAFFSLPHVFSKDAIQQERSHQREVDNLKSILSQKDEVIAEFLTEHIAIKKDWGEKLKVQWVSASVCDQIVDFIIYWKQRSGLRNNWFCRVFGLKQEKLIAWGKRYGLPNRHNGAMPKDSRLCVKEKKSIISFFFANRGNGYRRCAYMMIDQRRCLCQSFYGVSCPEGSRNAAKIYEQW